MATVVTDLGAPAAPLRGFRADQKFFTRFALALAAVIVLGFAQIALQGFVDYRRAPLRVHFHGAVMLAWLGLFVLQNRLIETGSIATHRKLGQIGVALAVAVAATGSWAGIGALLETRQPPFFSPPYFLALTQMGAVFFLFLVGWAVVRRRDTQWHRRLMLASLIAILEPAFGWLIPMPLVMPWGEMLVLLVQLLAFAVIMRHDRKVLGAVHPATWAGALVVTVYHLALELFGRVGPFVSWADWLTR